MHRTQPAKPDRSVRIMSYGHDSVGLGHFNRMLTICGRMRRAYPRSAILMATGTPYVPMFDLPEGVDYIKLPALAKPGANRYCSKFLKTSTQRVMDCRRALLVGAVQTFEPHVLLVDKAPAGVCGEMIEALQWLRKHRPRTRLVFGMRDIEDDPRVTIEQWNANGALEALEQYYDEIWVYGMRTVFDVASEYRLPEAIRRKLQFTGYVVREPCRHVGQRDQQRPSVLVTVGGGTDGHQVLETYLDGAADAVSSRGGRSILIGGPDLPRDQARNLAQRVRRVPGAAWRDYARCMGCCIRQAGLVVSMGGYNTLCEVVSRRKPAVVIPRTQPRREQVIRADRWSRRSPIDVLLPDVLTPAALSDHVLARLDAQPAATDPLLDFNGLDRVQRRFDALLGMEGSHAAPVRLH